MVLNSSRLAAPSPSRRALSNFNRIAIPLVPWRDVVVVPKIELPIHRQRDSVNNEKSTGQIGIYGYREVTWKARIISCYIMSIMDGQAPSKPIVTCMRDHKKGIQVEIL